MFVSNGDPLIFVIGAFIILACAAVIYLPLAKSKQKSS